MKALLAVMVLLTANTGFAQRFGTEGGNGGDTCELRIQEIRNDIQQWISKGGADALKFPQGVSLEDYKMKMNAAFSAEVACVSDKLVISGAEKTCVNTADKQIVCNIDRLGKVSASSQYVLIHHEYAGVAGLEVNSGAAASDYELSQQLTGFLKQELVTKLAVKSAAAAENFLSCNDNYLSALSVKAEKDSYVITASAVGYQKVLPLAEKLGLADREFTSMTVRIPARTCTAEFAQGRLGCYAVSAILVFRNAQGDVEPVPARNLEFYTGVMGVGIKSIQSMSLGFSAYSRDVFEKFGFKARYVDSNGNIELCNRPAL